MARLAYTSRSKTGFSTVELCVVMVVISIAMTLLFPAVQNAREAARRVGCKNQLRQLVVALHQYEGTHGVFPPGSQVTPFIGPRPFSKAFGWTVALLPYIDQSAIFSKFNFNFDCQIHHRTLTNRRVQLFECPSDPNVPKLIEWRRVPVSQIWGDYSAGGWGGLNYLGVSGTDGMVAVMHPPDCAGVAAGTRHSGLHDGMLFGNSSVRMADVIDGTSNTTFLGERGVTARMGKWGGAGIDGQCPSGFADVVLPGVIKSPDRNQGGLSLPQDEMSYDASWWSWHPGGSHFAMADGSVCFLSYSLDRVIQYSLATRAGSEPTAGMW